MSDEVETFSEEFNSLPDRHKKFVLEYLKNGMKAGGAYRSAYPDSNDAASETNGPRLLRKDQIYKAVRAELDLMLQSDKLQIEKLLYKNITEVLQAETGHYIDDDGNVDIEAIKNMNPGAIQSFEKEVFTGESGQKSKVRYTLESKAKAREHAAKLLGLIRSDDPKAIDLTGATVNIKISTNPNGGGDAD